MEQLLRYREVEQLELQVIETSKDVLGAELRDTLLAMRDLAVTYRFQGRCEDAKSLQFEVYGTRLRVLGDDHPEALIIMHDLAGTYLELLQLKEAETIELEMIRRCKRVLGGEHPHTLEGLRTLEFIFGIDGRRDEWLRIRQDILGLSSIIQINKIQPPLTTHTMSDQIVTYQKDTITPELRRLIKTNSFRGATDTPRYSSQSEPITIATKENSRGESHDNPSTTGGASLNNTASKVTHGMMRQYLGSVTSTMARRSKSEIVVEHAEDVLLDQVTESSQNDTGEGRTRKKRIWGMQRLLDKGLSLLKKGDHMETRAG